MPKLIGAPLSPFVRKARVALAAKGVAYELDPMAPFNVSDEYKRDIHPLGKIPALVLDDVVIPDSSAIVGYLDAKYPENSLYPSDPVDRGRAMWLEEYADTAAVPACGTVFFQKIVAPMFMNQEGDAAAIQNALDVEVPKVCEYLERQLPAEGFAVGPTFSVADIAITSPFVNLGYAGESIDAAKYPKLSGLIARTQAHPAFAAALEAEKAMLGGG